VTYGNEIPPRYSGIAISRVTERRREIPATARLYGNAACLVQFVDRRRASDFAGSQGGQRRSELDGSAPYTVDRAVLMPDSVEFTLAGARFNFSKSAYVCFTVYVYTIIDLRA